ncbi:MAG: hypothetical protein JO061_05175 [Acidobacteriaceae bacterium]|nr:hypothetical protein [Acidobacteriaceae bacterium]
MPNQTDLFSGTWKMNARKSKFDPNHQPSEATMRFEREAEGYLMRAEGTSDGKHIEEQPQRFMLDGEEYPVPGAPGVTTVSTRPDANTIQVSARNGDSVLGEGSYVVSADGATLTATVRGIDAQQRPFQTTVVWDRE